MNQEQQNGVFEASAGTPLKLKGVRESPQNQNSALNVALARVVTSTVPVKGTGTGTAAVPERLLPPLGPSLTRMVVPLTLKIASPL